VALMRSIPVVDGGAIAIAVSYDGIADFLLLDSHEPGDKQIGALGRTHDWTISRRIVESVSVPVILAGGLGPENVAAAIHAVQPAGVDSKTRTDLADGSVKDIDAVRAFVAAAKAAT
jgi:phosphoribosylanthranilate isomerase